MTSEQFLAAVAEILNTDVATISFATELASSEGYDSLARISLISLVDEQFGVSLTPAKLRALKTIGELYALKG